MFSICFINGKNTSYVQLPLPTVLAQISKFDREQRVATQPLIESTPTETSTHSRDDVLLLRLGLGSVQIW
jgi:hypothetical protein